MDVVAVTVRDTIWRQDNTRGLYPAIRGRMGGKHPVINSHHSLGSWGWTRMGRHEGTEKGRGSLFLREGSDRRVSWVADWSAGT